MDLAQNKLTQRLLLLGNTLFILIYAVLIYHNRYAADDYFFVYNSKLRGVLGAALFTANTWTPRPSEMLLYNSITKYFSEQVVLIGYGVVTLILLIIAVYKLVKLGLEKIELQLQPLTRFNFTLLICCAFFFTTISIGETWFWLCSSAGYLLSSIAFLWGFILLLNKKQNILTYILLLACFVYVTGAAETFAATVLIILWITIFVYVYLYKSELKRLTKNTFFTKAAVVLLVCTPLLIDIYLNTGTRFRQSLLIQASLLDTFYFSARTMGYLIINILPLKLPLLVLFSTPFLLIGKQLAQNVGFQTIFSNKAFAKIALLFVAVNYISFIPAAYIMSDRGPDRSFTFNAFLLVLMSIYFFIYLGTKIKTDKLGLIVKAALIAIAVVLIYTGVSQYAITKNYAANIDERIELVTKENKKGRTELLMLPPLPPSGFFYSAELSADTAYYTNTFFKMRYDLNFNCAVK